MKSIAWKGLKNKKAVFASCLVPCLKILLLSFLLLATSATPIAFAQTDKAVENMEALLSFLQPKKQAYERVLEERAKQILSTQLDAENYFITINVMMDEKNSQIS